MPEEFTLEEVLGNRSAVLRDERSLLALTLIVDRVGDELTLKYVPELRFFYDETAAEGARIDQLLKDI